MNSKAGVLIKVLLLSIAISLAIKYLGPMLELPTSSAIALAMVLIPPLMMGGLLLWRSQQVVK